MAEAGPVSPLKPGEVELPGEDVVSPAELLMGFINTHADPSVVPAGAVVGGADDLQQQQGVVALMDAGDAGSELYAPLIKKRVQVRCVGPTLAEADAIGNYIYRLLHEQRWLVLEDSAARLWFCHTIYCTVGPSHHIDSQETHESLLFAAVTLGDEPVGVPAS